MGSLIGIAAIAYVVWTTVRAAIPDFGHKSDHPAPELITLPQGGAEARGPTNHQPPPGGAGMDPPPSVSEKPPSFLTRNKPKTKVGHVVGSEDDFAAPFALHLHL